MPWKNGLGTTTEIYRAEGIDGQMDWRVSIAGVACDGPFSMFPGYDRHIMIIDGGGMILDGGPRGPMTVGPAFVPVSFSGDWTINARLTAGPLRDFNLIVRRGFGNGDLGHVTLTEPVELASGEAVQLVYVLSGDINCDHQPLPAGSAVLLNVEDSATLVPTGGPARVALCRIWRAVSS
jgi:uncharacterized protein